MQVGNVVYLPNHPNIIGVVIEVWCSPSALNGEFGNSMGTVEWCKNYGTGLYFVDELEVLCK